MDLIWSLAWNSLLQNEIASVYVCLFMKLNYDKFDPLTLKTSFQLRTSQPHACFAFIARAKNCLQYQLPACVALFLMLNWT